MAERSAAADMLIRATTRSRILRRKPLVIKLGGSAMEDPAATSGMLDAVAILHALGFRLSIVHGGGKPIDRAMEAAGIVPVKVQGRRYTDDQTLEIVVRVLMQIRDDLARQLEQRGCTVTVFEGPAKWPVRGERLTLSGPDMKPIDLGRVGQPSRIETAALNKQFDRGALVLLPSLAVDPKGDWLNVNADTAASAVGGALEAEVVAFLTDTPGVLRDRANPNSLVAHLSASEAKAMIASGAIAGGMIPKVEACFEALAAGAKQALILDGRNPDSLVHWLLGDPSGTTLTHGPHSPANPP